MSKTILVFSDGTGQIGGLSPDQRLSNVYKMYRAMRTGPDSPISPDAQVAFYDAGLGAGETGGLTFRRLRHVLAAAVGTGIDENVIDCYAAILARYEPGDRVCLFGFSRGAYTVRALANVMNLCGVPSRGADGGPLPRYGSALRAVASEAVRRVYNHGAGAKRSTFEEQREALAARFRRKYGSEGTGADAESQGNVQPFFIGVFDTVAALGSRSATIAAALGMVVLLVATAWLVVVAPLWVAGLFAIVPACAAYWLARSLASQVKFYLDDRAVGLRWWDPRRWRAAVSNMHFAWWSGRHYDRYVDREVRYLRHALSIDEDRARFPRVGWGSGADYDWNLREGRSDWLRQVWFAGNHSDIGGSYAEDESRLSDIALRWMVAEFRAAVGEGVTVLDDRLVTWPDGLGLQHSERVGVLDMQPSWLRRLTGDALTWRAGVRDVDRGATLHPTVLERLGAAHVPQMGDVRPYRPASLAGHAVAKAFYDGDVPAAPVGL